MKTALSASIWASALLLAAPSSGWAAGGAGAETSAQPASRLEMAMTLYAGGISMNALRSVDRNGGLDPFILKSKDSVLSPKALRLKRAIAKKAAAKAA